MGNQIVAEKKRVMRNPETNTFELVEGDALKKKSGEPDGLCASFFEEDDVSDDGKKFYSTFVVLGGHKVFINELSRKLYKEYRRREAANQQEMREVERLTRMPVEKIVDSDAHVREIETRADAVSEQQIGLHEWVIEKAVVDWELPSRSGDVMPCTPETRLAMRPSHKLLLSSLIAQKSALGRSQADF